MGDQRIDQKMKDLAKDMMIKNKYSRSSDQKEQAQFLKDVQEGKI